MGICWMMDNSRFLILESMGLRINPEVITMGRVSVDLYPEQIGVTLAEVETFAKSLGGSATNVSVAVARLGHPSAVITKVGDDGFGRYIRSALKEFGVDARWVGTDPELRTPLAFCEIHPPDDFPILFYRERKAPDMNLTVEDLDFDAISAVPLFWITGTGLSDEPSRTATLAALEHRPTGITVFDLDYRPTLWDSKEEAAHCYREALRHATVAVGNQSEVEVAEAPPIEVEIVNGLGAGDAFGGALCHALLSGWDARRSIRYANAAGAIVASRLACADDMPTRDEVERLLEVSSNAW